MISNCKLIQKLISNLNCSYYKSKSSYFSVLTSSKNYNLNAKKPNLYSQLNLVSSLHGLAIKSENSTGVLANILQEFSKCQINLTDLQTITSPLEPNKLVFNIFFEDRKDNTPSIVVDQLKRNLSVQVNEIPTITLPWFPQKESDLNLIQAKTMSRDEMLGVDHPGVKDKKYIKRREEIAAIARSSINGTISYVDYSDEENKLWNTIFSTLKKTLETCACSEFNKSLDEFIKDGIYTYDKIPQTKDVSDYITKKTGFKIRPIAGLLDSRDFLNALAYKTFYATQYLRHSSFPFYTPEPDLIHELIGHSVLFANKDFAQFTHLIGLASLGATDEQIDMLARLYWYTNEFGLLMENGKLKAYGAGVLSSNEELSLATNKENNVPYYKLDPFVASKTPYPLHSLQDKYFVANSLDEVKNLCLNFTQSLSRPFSVIYNEQDNSVKLTRVIKFL